MPIPDAAHARPLAVMSFNIFHDNVWERRKALVVSEIRDAGPDVIGLQEALIWQLEYFVAEMPEYAFTGVGRDDGDRGGESVGILYRKDRFELAASDTFWFSNQPEAPGSMPGADWGDPNFPRICTWIRLIEKATGLGFYIFNVHLQHNAGTDPELARVASVDLLIDRIKQRQHDDPIIVTGDFNATDFEAPILRMTGADPVSYCPQSGAVACRSTANCEPFVDTYRALYSGPAEGTRCFDNDDAGRRIDYVFASSGADVLDFKMGKKQDGVCASDHQYVLAVVNLWSR